MKARLPDGLAPSAARVVGELKHETAEGWQIISIARRFRLMPQKFNALAGLAQGDILVVWADDEGRFHASLAFRREAFDRIGGRPLTKRGDFDQQLIARRTAIEAPSDPCQLDSLSCLFRWGQTKPGRTQAIERLQIALQW